MYNQLILVLVALAAFASCLEAHTIACQRRTTKELELKLETVGGYNKNYQAITRKGAAKFPKLINQTAAVPMGKSRQARSFPQTNFTRSAKRGSLDQDGYHRLCTENSAVTTLPADHFPRFLNEIICDTNDSGCLSHQGVCIQGTFVVSVLKNTGLCGADGKETWEVVSQPVRSCCNCRLFPDSFLIPLM